MPDPKDVTWTHGEKQMCLDCSWWYDHKVGYLDGKRYVICMECGKIKEVGNGKAKEAR